MPLSTSNSDTMNNNNNNSWFYTWILVIILCVGVLGSYELFLKNKGFVASIENNNNLWSWYRGKVNNKPNSLVIIGASRSQLDINIPYLKEKLSSYDVYQLSINGHYPMATFKALADDEEFVGTLIVSLNAQAMEEFYFDMQLPQNEFYQNKSTIYKSLDAYLSALLQSKLRLLHPLLGLQQVVEFYDSNKAFKTVFYTTANIDQSVSANYSLTNVENLYRHFVSSKEENYKNEPPTAPNLWQQNIKLLLEYSEKIKSRGGQVILIRFPTDRGHWELDENYYPRKQYWNKISDQIKLNTVHFKDINGLDQFALPDSSHLDQKDTIEFTEKLFNELIKREYIN